MPAELARAIVRKFRGREMVSEVVAELIEDNGFEHEAVLSGLESAGYMEKVRVDNDGDVWWDTTIQGNALAMASFGKPISRKTADRLVSGLLERTHTDNADSDKPLFIYTLRVFGSYLSPEIDPIGDVDIVLTYGRRITDQKTDVGLHQSQRTIVQHVHGSAALAADADGPAPEETVGVHYHHA